MSTSRRILVDDADSAIQYGTGWFAADVSTLDTLGNNGPVYAGTSHGTTTNGATLSFIFSGTSLEVYGTIDILATNGVATPTWSCAVDGVEIDNPGATFPLPENNWLLCDQSQLASGSHTLTINVQTTGQAFYLDYILYMPTSDVSLDGAILEYLPTDPAVSLLGDGWQEWSTQNVTFTNGAQAALNFHGTAVTLIGFFPNQLPSAATTASYTLDGGDSKDIALTGILAGTTTSQYDIQILTVNGLAAADHKLVLTYTGDANHAPLPINSFFVTNAGAAAPAAPPSSSSSSNSNSGDSGASNPSSGGSDSSHQSGIATAPASTGTATGSGTTASASAGSAESSHSAGNESITIPNIFGTEGISDSSAVGAPGSTNTASSTGLSSSASSGSHTRAIIGGIVGCLAILALLVGAFLWRRRRRRQQAVIAEQESPSPYMIAAETGVQILTARASSARTVHGYDAITNPIPTRDPFASPMDTPSGPCPPEEGSFSSENASKRVEAEATSSIASSSSIPQRRRVVIEQTIDSGLRLPPTRASQVSLLSEPEVVQLPPEYSRN